jgi:hypothetical protein
MSKVILKKNNKNYVLPVDPTLDLDTNDTNFTNNDNESTGRSKLDLSNLDWGGIFDGVGKLFTGVGNFTSSITDKGKSDTIYNVYTTDDEKNNNTGQYVLYGGLILFVVIILFILLRNK